MDNASFQTEFIYKKIDKMNLLVFKVRSAKANYADI